MVEESKRSKGRKGLRFTGSKIEKGQGICKGGGTHFLMTPSTLRPFRPFPSSNLKLETWNLKLLHKVSRIFIPR